MTYLSLFSVCAERARTINTSIEAIIASIRYISNDSSVQLNSHVSIQSLHKIRITQTNSINHNTWHVMSDRITELNSAVFNPSVFIPSLQLLAPLALL